MVPQRCNDPGGYHTDGTFYESFVLRLPGAAGDNSGPVMLGHLAVRPVDDGFISGVLDDTSLEVVWCEDPRDAAVEAVSVHISRDPGLLLHVQKCLSVGITAVWQYGDKQIGLDHLSGVGVYDSRRVAGPVLAPG